MTNPKDVLEYMAWKEERERNMTNEEWLNSMTTEEKAKWLTKHSKFIYECGQKQVAPKIMYEEDWEWWLKEKHE